LLTPPLWVVTLTYCTRPRAIATGVPIPAGQGLSTWQNRTFKLALGPVNFAESGAGSIFSEP